MRRITCSSIVLYAPESMIDFVFSEANLQVNTAFFKSFVFNEILISRIFPGR